ncbi:Uncharacterised protein [BD1-7 clade bacterium]|uniref:Amidohydrolase-related domain-containing protein n=1 Tax=BD1-7 clade bacterium TaxID=2029982 RepID=A0A5S9NQ52_9GAMM|nr:Uncharacterised protein [BD1-7 clade bacterium]
MYISKQRLCGLLITLLLAACSNSSSDRESSQQCFNRDTRPSTAIVDSHYHMRPFGGDAIPYQDQLDNLKRAGIQYVNIYGIGQRLDAASGCTYYRDCPGVPAIPSVEDDLANAEDLTTNGADGIHVTLAMTFPDLAKPEDIVSTIRWLDEKYPNAFTWMGELNLVKEALFDNSHAATPEAAIRQWQEFMTILRDRNMPLSLHSDLGSVDNPTKYAHLMELALELYPNNIIVWHHMGISEELLPIDSSFHIGIIEGFLNKYPNLYLDISWRIIADSLYREPTSREAYVQFFNTHSARILPGTDFVAAVTKTYDDYQDEVAVTGSINRYLNDEAFRNIVLGQSYFDLIGLNRTAPDICQ